MLVLLLWPAMETVYGMTFYCNVFTKCKKYVATVKVLINAYDCKNSFVNHISITFICEMIQIEFLTYGQNDTQTIHP